MRLTRIRKANAVVIEVANGELLISYSTVVAGYLNGYGAFKTEQFWSRTTSRHISDAGYANAREVRQEFCDRLGNELKLPNLRPSAGGIRRGK